MTASHHDEKSFLVPKADTGVDTLEELKTFCKVAWPVVATYVCEFLPGLASVIFVGHLHGKEDLDATALATMYFNVFGMSLGIGMATAMDTLCAQANGAGMSRKIGEYLQRGLIILSVVAGIAMVMNYYAADILIGVGQDAVVSKMAGDYCRVLLPGLPFFYLYEMLKKCMQSQHVVIPAMLIAALTNALNVMFCYSFIYIWGWGYLGAAVARTLSAIAGAGLIVAYAMYDDGLSAWWAGWDSKEAWSREGLWEWLALGVPGCLMVCLEWWAFELVAIMAGWLPDPITALGVNVILLNCTALVFMLYLGVGVAATVRVGNLLGEGRPVAAQSVSKLAMIVGASLSLVCATSIMTFRAQIPSLYSNNPEIEEGVKNTLWVLAAYQLPDVLNCVASSVLKGCGMQGIGAKVYLTTYYGVGITSAFALAFGGGFGLEGLWVGMTGGVCVSCLVMIYFVFSVDWASASELARKTVGTENAPPPPPPLSPGPPLSPRMLV